MSDRRCIVRQRDETTGSTLRIGRSRSHHRISERHHLLESDRLHGGNKKGRGTMVLALDHDASAVDANRCPNYMVAQGRTQPVLSRYADTARRATAPGMHARSRPALPAMSAYTCWHWH